jgi:cell division septation protein DedD
VQFGAFSSRANADRRAATLSEQLRGKGYGVVSVMTVPTDALFRVRMGPFPARADAQGLADRLVREERITPSVLR